MYTTLTLFFQRGHVKTDLQQDTRDGHYWLSLAQDGTDLLLKLSQATLLQLAMQIAEATWSEHRLHLMHGDGRGAPAPGEALQQER